MLVKKAEWGKKRFKTVTLAGHTTKKGKFGAVKAVVETKRTRKKRRRKPRKFTS